MLSDVVKLLVEIGKRPDLAESIGKGVAVATNLLPEKKQEKSQPIMQTEFLSELKSVIKDLRRENKKNSEDIDKLASSISALETSVNKILDVANEIDTSSTGDSNSVHSIEDIKRRTG